MKKKKRDIRIYEKRLYIHFKKGILYTIHDRTKRHLDFHYMLIYQQIQMHLLVSFLFHTIIYL